MNGNPLLRISLLVLTILAIWSPTPLLAATFTVNQTADAVDANPGDGICDCDEITPGDQCSLRAAIQEANAGAGADTISLPAGVYTLSLVGVGEDFAATGDLDITDELTITGAGAADTVIDGNLYGSLPDRVFDVHGSVTVDITGVMIRKGLVIGENGGGIKNSGDLTLTAVIVDHNEAAHHYTTGGGAGGGIYNSGTLTLNNVDIRNNKYKSVGSGGGIYNTSAGTLTLNNSSVCRNGNVEMCNGSGVYNEGEFTSNNSTISENLATNIYCVGAAVINLGLTASTTLNNTTIADNIPLGIFQSAGTFTLQNTIIAGNGETGRSDCHVDSLSIDSLGYNLVGAADCVINSTTGDQIGTPDDPIDARLGRLISSPAYNPLFHDSPAIDAGNPAGCIGSDGELATDQRGAARVGPCDIGAYEFTIPGAADTVYANRGSAQHIGPVCAFRTPLEAAVMDSIGSPVGGVQVTFTVPTSGPSGTFEDTGTTETTAVTDESGVATAATLTANELLGSYTATATVEGIPTPADFALTNLVWYVAEDGDDTANDCLSPTSPCATINGVIGRVSDTFFVKTGFVAGDTIRVGAGTYTGTRVDEVTKLDQSALLSGGWNPSFTTQNGTSIIDGENARECITVWYGVRDFTIERFTAQNGSGRGIRIYGAFNPSSGIIKDSTIRYNQNGGLSFGEGSLILEDCTINGNTAEGAGGGGITNYGELTVNRSTISGNASVVFGGGGILNDGMLLLINSTISGNTDFSTGWLSGGGGILNREYCLAVMKNCTVAWNQANNGGGGIMNLGELMVTNCTITSNTARYAGGMDLGPYSSTTITNCILWADSPDEIIGGNPLVTYSDIQGGFTGESNINSDPLFVDAANGDLHLKRFSPCIDAGTNDAPELPDTDFEGDPRIIDGDNDGTATVDMGADEYILINVINVFLTPDTLVVPRGGTLGLQATITNNTDKAGIIRFATKVTLPNENPYPPSGYLFGPIKISLSPYQSKSGHLSHTIPMGAPLGIYTYHGYVGRPGMGIIDEDQFDFEVIEATTVIGPKDWETTVDQGFTE